MKKNLKFYLMSTLCSIALINTQGYSMNYNNQNMPQNVNWNNQQYNQQQYNNQNMYQNMNYNNYQYNQQQSYNNQNMYQNMNMFQNMYGMNNMPQQNSNNQKSKKENPNNLPPYYGQYENQKRDDYKIEVKNVKQLVHSVQEDIAINEKNVSKGLENIGATCYMNATLQCLYHTSELTDYLINNSNNIINKLMNAKEQETRKYWNENNKQEISITDMPVNNQLMIEYINLIANLASNNGTQYYNPKEWKEVLSVANPLFQGIQANDSKDLVAFLLEAFHNVLNNPANINNNNNTFVDQYDRTLMRNNFLNEFYNGYKSIISDLFYGLQETQTCCQTCNKTVYNFQTFPYLIFPIEEVMKYDNLERYQALFNKNSQQIYTPTMSIEKCFKYFEKVELFTEQNQISCNSCGGKLRDAQYFNKISAFPDRLFIVCNRGKDDKFKCNVKAPNILDLSQYENESKSNNEQANYELSSIIVHIGPSSIGGHFIAYCKTKDGWYKYNDAFVDKVDDNTMQQIMNDGYDRDNNKHSNYIYLYKRTSPSKMQQLKQIYLNQNNNNINLNNNNNNNILQIIENNIIEDSLGNFPYQNNFIKALPEDLLNMTCKLQAVKNQIKAFSEYKNAKINDDEFQTYFKLVSTFNNNTYDNIKQAPEYMRNYVNQLLRETLTFVSHYRRKNNESYFEKFDKVWNTIGEKIIGDTSLPSNFNKVKSDIKILFEPKDLFEKINLKTIKIA